MQDLLWRIGTLFYQYFYEGKQSYTAYVTIRRLTQEFKVVVSFYFLLPFLLLNYIIPQICPESWFFELLTLWTPLM